jgi:chemotaxis protein MotB
MPVENPETLQPIIIKKKIVHGGHHGGAWKVAYADFVTAMMALFIVLWLMNSNEEVKQAVGGYFRDPSGSGKEQGNGQAGLGQGIGLGKQDMGKLKEKLESVMKEAPELAKFKDQVQMTVTGEGLRVELLETEVGMFFQSGRAEPSASGQEMLTMLARELSKLDHRLLIEGHTDSRPFAAADGRYTNWELSADRANAARKLMIEHGLRADQVAEIRGYADQRLRHEKNPEDASNRRVSIVVQYKNPPPGAKPAASAPAKPSAAHH